MAADTTCIKKDAPSTNFLKYTSGVAGFKIIKKFVTSFKELLILSVWSKPRENLKISEFYVMLNYFTANIRSWFWKRKMNETCNKSNIF